MGTVRYTTVNGEVIAEKRNGVRSLYVPDPLGSTAALLDNTQTKTDTFEYWPYGEVRTRTGTNVTPFQFVGTQGYYRDSNSRMYVRARMLDAPLGRWMTQDPIGFDGDDTNLYRYSQNNVTTFIDPSGNKPPGYPGYRLCKRLHPGGTICSDEQWNKCLRKCHGINNVKYCCNNPRLRNNDPCVCLSGIPHPMRPGTGVDYPTNCPNSGFGPSSGYRPTPPLQPPDTIPGGNSMDLNPRDEDMMRYFTDPPQQDVGPRYPRPSSPYPGYPYPGPGAGGGPNYPGMPR
jgi:RHS repeat-associated protein